MRMIIRHSSLVKPNNQSQSQSQTPNQTAADKRFAARHAQYSSSSSASASSHAVHLSKQLHPHQHNPLQRCCSFVVRLLLLLLLLMVLVLLWMGADRAALTSSILSSIVSSSSSSSSSSSTSRTSDITSLAVPKQPVTVAYVISLIKCGDHQSNPVGMMDAATVFSYSVHRHSIRHELSNSKYDYKLYAIVHEKDAQQCLTPTNSNGISFQDLGYEVLLRDSPVALEQMQSEALRKAAPKAWCCGHAEFIKLYAYTLLQHEIVVHVDMDFLFTQPMDVLYDAMLYDATSPQGMAARSQIPLERPTDPWPDRIEAFITRDWGQVIPGRKAGYQAGFLVLRPSMQVFDQILQTIRESEYIAGFERTNGWGGKGYGGFVGAAAMQGLLAYFYDEIRPGTSVELNQCRFNHMGMDVLYRAMPAFLPRHAKRGKCRNDLDYCEDCQTTPLEQIYSIHYTQCRKPWNCIGESIAATGKKEGIPEDNVIVEHCLQLSQTWNDYRTDLERQLFQLTADETIRYGQNGTYMTHVFQGHCKGFGGTEYLPIRGKPETLRRIPELFAVVQQ